MKHPVLIPISMEMFFYVTVHHFINPLSSQWAIELLISHYCCIRDAVMNSSGHISLCMFLR